MLQTRYLNWQLIIYEMQLWRLASELLVKVGFRDHVTVSVERMTFSLPVSVVGEI